MEHYSQLPLVLQHLALNQLRRRMSCLRVGDRVSKCGREFDHQRHVVIADPLRLGGVHWEDRVLKAIEQRGAILLEESAHARTHVGPNIRHMIGGEGRQ